MTPFLEWVLKQVQVPKEILEAGKSGSYAEAVQHQKKQK